MYNNHLLLEYKLIIIALYNHISFITRWGYVPGRVILTFLNKYQSRRQFGRVDILIVHYK